MRPHGAVFRLFLAHTVGKVLAVLVLLGAAEAAVALWHRETIPQVSLLGYYERCATALGLLFLAATVLISVLLLGAGLGWGKGRPGDTLDRLTISPGWVVFWQGLYNALAFLLLWGVQALLLAALAWFYGSQGGQLSPQSFYLLVWQRGFPHFLLPLGDVVCWISHIFLAAGLGCTAACFSQGMRQGRWNLSFPLLVLCALPFLGEGYGWGLMVPSVLCGAAGLGHLRWMRKEARHEETKAV